MKKSLLSAIILTLLASASVATAQIQMTFSIVQPTCHGFTNGSATVFPVGGTSPYTYAWSTNQTTQTTFGLGKGTYTVTVTDALLNSAVGQISVSEPSAVLASITGTNVNCAGNNGTLTANGFGGTPPYTYAWDGPGGTSSFKAIPVVAPGNYFVTVTDANHCSGVGSYTVDPPIAVEVTATDIPCSIYPQGGSANAVVTGGKPPYAYSWSNGAHTSLITNISQGSYVCTVTGANGCIAIDSDYVDMPAPLVTVVTWLTPSCGFSNNGTATVQASGGTPPYTYNWPSPLPSGPSQTGLAPGPYYVCTFDSNHCQKDLWVNIPHITGLDVQLVVNSATCVGIDNATATAVVTPPGNNYVYQWNILPPDSNVIQVTGLAAGTFVSVVVTDTISGCTGTASGIVGAHATVDIAVTDVDILCAGGFGSATAVASNGTPQYTYTWFSNNVQIANTASIDSLQPGAYLVSVVDANGCKAQAVADIGIQSAPHAAIDGGHTLVCGDSLSVVQFTNQSTDPYNTITTLVWTVTGPHIDTVINQQNQITFQLPVDDTITVQLIATSGLGCSDTATLVYNVPGIPGFSISLDSTSINCTGDSIRINVVGDPSYTYVWTPAVTLNPNPLHVLVYPTVNTTYILTATDGKDCKATDSISIEPAGGLFQLFVSETNIQTCDSFAVLSASTIPPGIPIEWTGPNGTPIPGNPITVVVTPNTLIYTVKATSSDSCFLKQEVSVTGYGVEVNIDPNAETSVCEGDSLTLSVIVTPPSDSLTYWWSVIPAATLINPTSAHPVLTGTVGVYTVTVIVTNVICSDTLSFPVEIVPGLNIDPQISMDLCKGLEVHFFNGVPGTWNFGDNSAATTVKDPVHTYAAAGQYHVTFTPSLQCTKRWESTITVHDSPLSAGILHNYVDCIDDAQIQFLGSSNYPVADIATWEWTFTNGTPATASIQSPIITFTHEGIITATLVVRDINGCLDTVSIPVEVHIINDNIPNAAEICPGESVQLNPDGVDFGANYTWVAVPADPSLIGHQNEPNPSVTPTVPTTYTLTITQGPLTCSKISTVQVTFKPGGQVTLADDFTACSKASVTLTAQSNGATGYEWSLFPDFNPVFATTQTVQVTPPATVYVRTTGGVCNAIDSIHVGLSIPVVQIAQSSDIPCPGGLGSATAVASNGTPQYTYTWFGNNGQIGSSASISDLTAGTYIVLVEDAAHCKAQDTVEIRLLSAPNAVIDSNVQILECGDSLSKVQITSLSTDPISTIASIEWIINGVVVSQSNPFVVQLPVHQNVTVQLVAISATGCLDTTSLQFYVPGIPDISVSLDSTTINCNGGPMTITVVTDDPDYDFEWAPAVIPNPDQLHVLVNPAVLTTYVLTATDGNVCTASASIAVAPADGTFELIVADSLIQTCLDSIKLFANTIPPGIAIEWTGPNGAIFGNPVTVPATPTPTVYTVKAFTPDSCSRTDQVVVTGFGVNVSIDPNAPTSVCEGGSLPLSVIVTPGNLTNLSYLWSVNAPATLSDPSSAHPVLTGPPGVYTVTVIVTNVICSDTLSFPVEIIPGLDLNAHISIALCNGLEVGFNNDSIPGLWNFGDGNTSTLANPVHTYGNAGQFTVTFTPNNLLCTTLWDSTITVNAFPLSASIGYNYINCIGQAEIQFNGSSNYPVADIAAWDWTFSSGTPTTASIQNPIVTFIQEGIITASLVVRDLNGCLDTVSLPVEVHIVNDNIPNAAEICPGESVQLNPDGQDLGANYVWTAVPADPSLVGHESEPNPLVTPNVPTTYTVTIGQDSCFGTYTVQVNFKPGGQIILTDDFTACSNAPVTLTAQSNGATGFEWSLSPTFNPVFATTQTVQVTPPATVYVRTTGGVCSAMDSVHIGLSTPVAQIAQSSDIPCPGGSGSATAVASNGTPQYTYTWFDNNGQIGSDAGITGLVPGTYTVSVTDAAGCTAQASVDIHLLSAPNAIIDSAHVVMCGDSLSTVSFTSFSGDPVGTITSIQWIVNGSAVSQANPLVIQLPVHQNATVELIAISATGCQDTTSLDFYVPGIPDIAISLDSATLNCNGGPVKICISGGFPGYDYVWQPAVTPTADPFCVMVDIDKTYALTATDGNICSATAGITTPDITPLQLTLSQTQVITCSDSAVIWASTNIPATIVWTDAGGNIVPSHNDTISVPATATLTIYTATATAASSSICTATGQASVTGQGVNVSLDAAAADTICAGQPLALSVTVVPTSVTYLWSVNAPATLSNPASANPMISGPAGNYTVSVTVANAANTDCTDFLEFPVTILDAVNLGLDSINICPEESVSLNPSGTGGGPGATYHWTANPPDPTLIPGVNDNILNPTVTPGGPTTYTLAVGGNGLVCPALFTMKVGFKSGGLVHLPDDFIACSNDPVTLIPQSNGAPGYEWSLFPTFNPVFATTQTVQVTPPSTVYVRTTGAECTAMDSVHIGLSTPVAQIAQSSDIPCPGGLGSATAVASNGTPQYTYTWFGNNGQIGTSASITGLVEGTYTVTVEDSAHCKAQASVDIQLLSAPSAIIDSKIQVLECGDSLSKVQFNSLSTDSISTIASIEWGINGTVVSLSNPFVMLLPVHQTVTVQLVVFSATGCQDTTSVDFYVPGIPDIAISLDSATLNCNGDPVKICISGGLPGYDYVWDPAITPTADPLCVMVDINKTYALTATDGNTCSATAGITTPDITPLQLTLSQTQVITCSDSAVIWASTNIPATIVWTDAGGNIVPSPGDTISVPATATTTTYTATATTASSSTCTAVGQVSVTGQGVNVSLDPAAIDTVCAGQPLALSVTVAPTSVTYLWSVNAPATLSNPASANPMISGPAGNYTVSVTVANAANTDCTDFLEFPVTILDAVNLGLDSLKICPEESVSLNPNGTGGSPGATYHWTANPPDPTLVPGVNDNILNPTVTPGGPTTYTLAVGGNGLVCPALFTMKVGFKPGGLLNLTKDTTVCDKDSLLLIAQTTGTAGYEWSIYPGFDTIFATTSTVKVQPPGTFYVRTSGAECNAKGSVQVSLSPPIAVSLDVAGLNCNGDPVTLCISGGLPGYSYAWEPAVTTTTDPLCFTADPDMDTNYVLTATDGNKCTATASIPVQAITPLLLTLSDTLIQTCRDSVEIWATTNMPATIVWTGPGGVIISQSDTIKVAATPSAIYTATATATSSSTCTAVSHVSVSGQSIDVSLDPSITDTICAGQPFALSVIVTPSTVTYLWSVNLPATIIDPTSANPVLQGPAGNYMVSVTVANALNADCTDSLAFPVTILDTIDLAGQVSVDLCHGLEVKFKNPTGIGGNWDFGDGSAVSNAVDPLHTYATAGVYIPVFTPSVLTPCINPWTDTLTVYDSVLTVGITHAYVNCALEAVIQYNGHSNRTDNIFWDWTFSNGTPATSTIQNPIITYTNEGTYVATLTVTDINHCLATATDSVTVNILSDVLDDSLKICKGDSIRLNPVGIDPDAKYKWTSVPPDSTLDMNNPNPIVSPSVPTVYTATISQGACSVTYTVAVGFKPSTDVHIIADPSSSVCSSDLWMLTAQSNNATTFEWSSSHTFMPIFDTLKTVHVMANGTYFVRTSGIAVCPSIDSIVIDLKMPEIQVVPADHDICFGEQAALMFTSLIPDDILTCDWGPNLPTDCNLIVSPDTTTTYSVIVTNQYGCKDTLDFTVNVTTVSVDADATPDVVTLQDPTTVLTATTGGNGTVVSYEWTPPGTLSSPHTAQTEATPTETTIYTVTVTTEDGCIATDTVMVTFRHNECIPPFVFVPKAFTPNHDQKNDFFIPRADGMTAMKFIVWDRWGEIVYETDDPNAQGWDGTYKGKEATPDSYAWYVWITCGNGDIYESKGNVTLLK